MSETASDRLQLPVLPLKETVVFPESMTPLAVGQERSVRLIDDVVSGERMLALFTVEDEEADPPGWDDLYRVGTVAVVHKMIKVPDGTLRILVQGVQRVRLVKPLEDDPYLVGELEDLPEVVPESPEVEALTRTVQQQFAQIIGMTPYLPEELQLAAANVDDPTALTHLIASTLRLKTEERQELLETADVEERLRRIASILGREVEMSELGSKIQSQVASEIDKGQREFFLRQQLKAIQEELGETDDHQAEINELVEQLEAKNLPEHAAKAAMREVNRLERLPPAAAEYGVIRTYLDWIISLPWGTVTDDNLDLDHAQEILDEDHFDLEKVKERIIEYLAVSKLKNDLSSPILCFVGPPGVGKTSLGQSVARALGRTFARISVGGVRDESEIRGHRRTYIGAMPGTIVRAIRDAESSNPVFLIDEIDKMGADFRGDPASAMLEVLDPEQHSSFRDHYLDLPYDLSKVLFICTANTLDTIPGPLLDRMDVIQLSGYTHEEKLGIAKRYLVPKQITAHGLKKSQLAIPDRTLRLVIAEYTREAGVRNLDRQIATLCRKAATLVATGHTEKIRVDEERRPRVARRAQVLRRRPQADGRPGRRDGARVHRRRRRRPLHRGDRVPRQRQADDHGPARRGDAGVGAGGALLGALARGRARPRRRVVRAERRPRPRARRRGAEGRALGRGDDGDDDRLTRPRRSRRRRRRHDRRDHAHRPGAADRRRPREGARGRARRAEARDPPARERARPRRSPGRDPRRARVRARRPRRGGLRGRVPRHDRQAPAGTCDAAPAGSGWPRLAAGGEADTSGVFARAGSALRIPPLRNRVCLQGSLYGNTGQATNENRKGRAGWPPRRRKGSTTPPTR